MKYGNGWLWMLLICMILFHKPIMKVLFVMDYRQEIVAASQTYEIRPNLLSAIIFVESRFDPSAQSRKGAMGLMQIMPKTGEWVAQELHGSAFHVSDLYNPQKNIVLGSSYFHYLKRRFDGDETKALAAYNAGFRYVQDWLDSKVWEGDIVRIENIPFSETKNYIFQVTMVAEIYEYLYPELA